MPISKAFWPMVHEKKISKPFAIYMYMYINLYKTKPPWGQAYNLGTLFAHT